MTHCRLCDSPLSERGCSNADCGLWEGPGINADVHLDTNGTPWQSCPRCGQDRIPSANGIRRHDEFCAGVPRDRAKERARMLDLLASMDIPSDEWEEEVDRRVDFNREGDPAFNGAFDRW